jgi:ABC-type uncharacterized transport system involved in gliding motility auxiliary subunit
VLGGSEELDEYSLYHIDRYIQLGGRVFFGVESVNVDLNTLEGRLKNDKGLLSMISYYGITLGQSLVLDQACLSVQYSQLSRPVRYPPWVRVLENQSSEDHPLVAFFGGVDLFWASPLYFTLPESGAVKGETLFTSSPNAWLMADTFFLSPEQSSLFALGSEETAGEKILAAALEGTFPSWFEGVEKPRRYKYGWDDDEEEEELPPMPPAPRESRIVVVGDADIGSRLLSQQSGNLNFLLKAADWLGKDDDIVGIRNRQSGSGRLDRITDEAKQRGVINFSRILNIVIVPMMIAIYGITRLVKRNRKKEQDHGL